MMVPLAPGMEASRQGRWAGVEEGACAPPRLELWVVDQRRLPLAVVLVVPVLRLGRVGVRDLTRSSARRESVTQGETSGLVGVPAEEAGMWAI
eukprot:784986-Pleurochrysis_carterae.AAC.4